MSILAQMSWSLWLLSAFVIFICCFLMLVILLQKGRGGGLSSAFGGGGGSSAFGAKTGDVFTWITVVVAGAFLLVCVLGNYAFDQSPRKEPVAEWTTPTPIPAPSQGEMIPITITPEGNIEGRELLPIKITPAESPPASGTEAAGADDSEPGENPGSP